MDIYVGNLSRTTTEEGLRSLFESHGAVASVKIMTDKFTGDPRGFGFVKMTNDSEAEAAIAALHGKEFDGRNLTVNQARPQEPREGGFRPRGGGGGGGGFNRDRGNGGDRGGFRGGSRY